MGDQPNEPTGGGTSGKPGKKPPAPRPKTGSAGKGSAGAPGAGNAKKAPAGQAQSARGTTARPAATKGRNSGTATKQRGPKPAAGGTKQKARADGRPAERAGGTAARKQAQRQAVRRPPETPGVFSRRGIIAIGVGAFVLTIANLPKVDSSSWSPEAAVAFLVGVAGLPLLVARAVGRGGARRTGSEVWAARLALAFVAAGVISALLAVSPTMATFGLFQHGTGWLFLALLAGWWALGTGVGPSDRPVLETALVWAAIVNASLAILQQLFGLGSIGLEGDGGQPDGFLGNPVFLGGLLAASLALIAPRFVAAPGRWWPAVAVVGIGLGVDGERLPALLVVVTLVWLAAGAWRARRAAEQGGEQWRHTLYFAGAVVAAALVGSLIAKLRGGLGVVSHTASSTGTEPYGQRIHAWVAGWHGFLAHPLLGSGPGQFRAATSSYYSVADARADGSVLGTFPDAHNFLVEFTVTTGIIGLGLLLAWLAFSVRGRTGPLLGFAAVLGAMQLAEPLNVVITPLTFLALGGAALKIRAERAGGADPAPAGRPSPPRWIEPATLIAACVALIPAILLVVADISYEKGIAHGVNKDYPAATASASTANSLMGFWPDPATLLGTIQYHTTNGGTAGSLAGGVRWAQAAVDRDPTSAPLWGTLAQYQGVVGDQAGARASSLNALKYQPTYVPALNVLGLLDAERHHNAQAESWFERSLAISPDQTKYAKLLADLKRGCTALPLTAQSKGLQLHCPPGVAGR